jgi:hypothetical protein
MESIDFRPSKDDAQKRRPGQEPRPSLYNIKSFRAKTFPKWYRQEPRSTLDAFIKFTVLGKTPQKAIFPPI